MSESTRGSEGLSWFQRLFGRRRADPAQHVRFIVPALESGVRLTEDEALSLSAVWACIDAIAKAIASCRWDVYQPMGNGRRRHLDDDPLAWVLNTRPNPDMTGIGFREAMLYTAIPFGNAYAEIVRDGGGRVAQLWPLEVERVTPRRDPQTSEIVYEYRQPDGEVVVLEARRVFHLRGPGLSGLMGENLVARAARSLSVAAAAERFSSSFFGNSAQPTGAIKHPNKLTPQAHENLRKDIDEKRRNKHSTIILEEGMEWVSFTTEPQKTQLIETRQFSVEEICRWFGVPPHKVQHLLRSTFSNIEHQSIEFVRDALTPWCRRLEQEADFKLFPQTRGPWRYTHIDTAPLSYGDANSRAAAHAVWRQNGIMSANEIRAREGLNDAGPDGDVLLVQSNLTTVQNIVAAKPAAPAAPAPAPAEEDLDPSVDASLARDAVASMFGAVFDRYTRRLAARRVDLERNHPPDRVEALMDSERQRLGPWLVAECAPAVAMARRAGFAVADADVRIWAAPRLDAGEDPATVARSAVLSTPASTMPAP